MNHAESREVLAAHALGSLDEAEAQELARHLSSCVDCRAELAALREAADSLALTLHPVAAPPALRERILAALAPAGTSVPSKPRAPRRVWGPLGGLALAAAVAGLVVSHQSLSTRLEQARAELGDARMELAEARGELQEERREVRAVRTDLERMRRVSEILATPELVQVILQGTEKAPRARARLVLHRETGRTLLAVSDLPPVPTGKAYQLWYITGETPLPGGLFATRSGGDALLGDEAPPQGRGASVFAVTLEPASGVPAPTGDMVLLGKR